MKYALAFAIMAFVSLCVMMICGAAALLTIKTLIWGFTMSMLFALVSAGCACVAAIRGNI